MTRTCEIAEAMGAQALERRTSSGEPVALRAGKRAIRAHRVLSPHRRARPRHDDCNARVQRTSSPVTVDVGPPYPMIALTAPVPGSSVRGSIAILIDGVATGLVPGVAGNTLTFQWSTTALAAGSHTLTVGVSNASALTATSPPVHVTGTVGPLNRDHRRHRFEAHTDTTIAQFAAAPSDMAFARA
jgi:hypothetical protein